MRGCRTIPAHEISRTVFRKGESDEEDLHIAGSLWFGRDHSRLRKEQARRVRHKHNLDAQWHEHHDDPRDKHDLDPQVVWDEVGSFANPNRLLEKRRAAWHAFSHGLLIALCEPRIADSAFREVEPAFREVEPLSYGETNDSISAKSNSLAPTCPAILPEVRRMLRRAKSARHLPRRSIRSISEFPNCQRRPTFERPDRPETERVPAHCYWPTRSRSCS